MPTNEKLKAARLARNWTPAQISAFLEINDQTYANWENGNKPSERNTKKLCALFRKTREELGL